ncbi:helix-turn-helix transcriptional regulator [Aquabacter sp. L1I39]|uniref:ArsR/SmtB family transcription factor n=1 Tax=Aquabacter sp. L1I39 TaxID=2820278 RepID=UPI001ADA4EF3|nr:helix-turn-helix transcriptional regulator [Aquabacter sp. L1I39]QTL02070.1 helix-turn-helix transcriptional regulator [Aquabacter sp. L1I39]
MPDETGHPALDEMELGAMFAALADPLRRQVVLTLAASQDTVRHCSAFDLPVTKATRTHHFRVLRESGLIRQVDCGNARTNRLRWDDLRARFPDLVALLQAEAEAQAAHGTREGAARPDPEATRI